ncbi:MAG: hypothetical protein KGO96_09100 [Elusimicrobia bacterium]|nr:hypothetical protein [Elusimicrobiota bacterium]MDE2236587.1 hypothetical protein [Elusimicrobiota bacterium]MDE2426047.1 hypothetical protein [Elusimicrobiota bacterium]
MRLGLAAGSAALLAVLPAARAAGQQTGLGRLVAQTQKSCTVSAAVGPLETPLSPEWARFLLDHPDLSASLVRSRGIAPYRITMIGPRRSLADDGDGTKGIVSLFESKPERRVYYCDGAHSSRLFPTIHASAVVVMSLEPAPRPGRSAWISSRFDVCVKLRNPLLAGMVHILGPFVRRTILRKFSKAFDSAQRLGVLLSKRPDALLAQILAYPGLSPQDRRLARRLAASLTPHAAASDVTKGPIYK